MYSAFGVDHGYEQVSKLGMPGMGAATKLGGAMGSKSTQMGGALRKMGGANKRAGTMLGKKPDQTTSMGMQARGHQRLGQAQSGMGAKMKQAGAAMSSRPGMTGGLTIGGGTAIGGGAYAMHRRQQ